MFKRIISILAVGLCACAGALAAPIVTETWYLGSFGGPGSAVVGAGPAGGALNPGAPAWTFTIADDHVLSVVDCCSAGDQFEIFDFGSSLGLTAIGTNATGCFTAATCDADPTVGRGDFLLGAGSYSITMTTVLSPFGSGNLFFTVRDAADVPEPATLLLAATSLGLLALGSRRRRQA